MTRNPLTSAGERLRIVVLGYIVRGPLGGLAWHHLQYVLGCADLGHDVVFIEDSDDYPSCYDPTTYETGTDPRYGLRFANDCFRRLDLSEHWAYYDAHASSWHGPCKTRIADVLATADVLLNVSGVNPLRPWMMEVPCRVLIDTDPAFTQIRHLSDPQALATARAHTVFFSFAESVGTADAQLPDDGLPWRPTRQPVTLGCWPNSAGPREGAFTTVMHWNSYPSREFRGVRYGMKSDSFQAILDLPGRCRANFELAFVSSPTVQSLLESHGWRIVDPLLCSRDPWMYQDYVQRSRAEFTVAKHGYVVSNSGWFSERSACYLASGRPVICLDTGFSARLPTGEGLFAYRTLDEAAQAVEAVQSRYEFHCRRARDLAAEYFDSDRVLSELLTVAMNARNEPVSAASVGQA